MVIYDGNLELTISVLKCNFAVLKNLFRFLMVPSWLKMSVNLLIAELGAGLSSWESDRRGQSGGVVRRKKGSDWRDLKGWRIQSGLLWDENQGVLDSQTEIVSEHLSDLLGEWVEWSFCTGRERKHSCSSQFWRFLFSCENEWETQSFRWCLYLSLFSSVL